MKLKQRLLFILLSPYILIAQTLHLAIETESPRMRTITVFVNDNLFKKETKRTLFIPIKSSDRITIQQELYSDFNYSIPQGLKKEDTIYKTIKLIPKTENMRVQNLEEFSVSNSKYQNLFKNKNEFIIDYYPFPEDKFFVITRLKGTYYIKMINEIGNELLVSPLNFKPTEIFLDVIGNFHLIAKDSVYQIYTETDAIFLMKAISKHDYEKNIENLVALGEYGAFHQNLSLHNQNYTVSKVINKNANNIYQTFDSEQYKTAEHYYNRAIGFYMGNTRNEENIISMGLWDGDLMTLNHSFETRKSSSCNNGGGAKLDISGFISWSEKIASKPLNVKSYGLSEKIIVLDGVKDSVFQIQYSTLEEDKSKAKFELSGEYFKDYFYDEVYMYSNEKGEITVSKINPTKGTSTNISQLTGIHEPRNIKVLNNKVFFTVLDKNQFNRIVQVKN
ncbi:hypothetical protein [Brumimicrobium oceani]|uniref:Uncharacterized protein n=1 Tax=Brumimicrobium oceani TaxID=2100725 RepID=A0A2U2XFR7_9FLAO|nr:hypothetical protein [Brumimicrobium oceani]PWH86646.1 hypothetical protein DIT68_05280 [Brumimicrobium oceani]